MTASAWAQGAAGTSAEAGTQQTQPGVAEQMQPPTSSDFSDREVKQFAKANNRISAIEAEYTEKLQGNADDQEKVVNLQEEAQDKMVQAVEDSGLEVQRYNDIIRVAQSDPMLVQRIQQHQ